MSEISLADFTGPGTDQGGGQYEQWISDEAPDHDPFADYPPIPAYRAATPSVLVDRKVTYNLAHNLDVRRQKIWVCWGKGTIVGWIGDVAHQAECSDHNPDSTGTVHAIDPMVTGARAQAIVTQCLAHNGDLQYVIHNRVIWSATVGWKARKYTGSDPHTDHVHISGKHGSSHSTAKTCTGYSLAAESATPTFNICPPPPTPGGTVTDVNFAQLVPDAQFPTKRTKGVEHGAFIADLENLRDFLTDAEGTPVPSGLGGFAPGYPGDESNARIALLCARVKSIEETQAKILDAVTKLTGGQA